MSRYTRFLEEELIRMRRENDLLLSAILDRVSPEAANMLRGKEKAVTDTQVREKAKVRYEDGGGPVRVGWRSMAARLSKATRPVADPTDSVDKLERRTQEAQQ